MRGAKRPLGENIILKESVEALRRIGFLQDVRLVPPSHQGTDGKLQLKGEWGAAAYMVEVQPKLSESAFPGLSHRFRQQPPERRLLVTSYVPPALAEQLQERRIEFLDAAGNAYLDRPIYLFVFGKKTKHLRPETATLHTAEDEKAVMSRLRLIPDLHGNITLLRTFGTQNANDDGPKEFHLADPLLIHAELVQMTGDRIQEIGNILLDQHILPRLA